MSSFVWYLNSRQHYTISNITTSQKGRSYERVKRRLCNKTRRIASCHHRPMCRTKRRDKRHADVAFSLCNLMSTVMTVTLTFLRSNQFFFLLWMLIDVRPDIGRGRPLPDWYSVSDPLTSTRRQIYCPVLSNQRSPWHVSSHMLYPALHSVN